MSFTGRHGVNTLKSQNCWKQDSNSRPPAFVLDDSYLKTYQILPISYTCSTTFAIQVSVNSVNYNAVCHIPHIKVDYMHTCLCNSICRKYQTVIIFSLSQSVKNEDCTCHLSPNDQLFPYCLNWVEHHMQQHYSNICDSNFLTLDTRCN